jgi:hypothetical protein
MLKKYGRRPGRLSKWARKQGRNAAKTAYSAAESRAQESRKSFSTCCSLLERPFVRSCISSAPTAPKTPHSPALGPKVCPYMSWRRIKMRPQREGSPATIRHVHPILAYLAMIRANRATRPRRIHPRFIDSCSNMGATSSPWGLCEPHQR